jgi:hypothetical protein
MKKENSVSAGRMTALQQLVAMKPTPASMDAKVTATMKFGLAQPCRRQLGARCASGNTIMKRRRLPKPTDRHADLLSAWVDGTGQLGIEVNDHGTVFALLLRPADKRAVTYLVEAASRLQALPIQPPDPPLTRKAPGGAGKRERLETRPGGIADTDEPIKKKRRKAT